MISFEEWIKTKKSIWKLNPSIIPWMEIARFPIEYNSNTSAGHPIKDDDIVRYSEETQRVQDKELEY